MRLWYQRKSPEERRAWVARRDPAKVRAADSARYYRNPLKRRARAIVGVAIAKGRLARAPCEKCGEQRSQAHHDDYSKPLDVRWLCRAHHDEAHCGPPEWILMGEGLGRVKGREPDLGGYCKGVTKRGARCRRAGWYEGRCAMHRDKGGD